MRGLTYLYCNTFFSRCQRLCPKYSGQTKITLKIWHKMRLTELICMHGLTVHAKNYSSASAFALAEKDLKRIYFAERL